MSLYFPNMPLRRFEVSPTSLDRHPNLAWNLAAELYELTDPETEAWRYFQFRLLPDVPAKVDDWTISSDFIGVKRFKGEDFSALVVGVWTGVSPQVIQTALFHAGHTAYTVFKGKRMPLDVALDLGKGVARSYVTFHCPERLETLDHYLKTS